MSMGVNVVPSWARNIERVSADDIVVDGGVGEGPVIVIITKIDRQASHAARPAQLVGGLAAPRTAIR